MNEGVETLGLPRSYFYQRFVHAAREVLARGHIQEDREPEMATKVNLQEALNRLVTCPVCGDELVTYPEYPMERSCECGDFTPTEVYSDGDVVFEFKMVAPEKLEDDDDGADEGDD